MNAPSAVSPIDWSQLSLSSVEFISLRLNGETEGSASVQVTYDRGCVLSTTGAGTNASVTRVLELGEVKALLASLRSKARASSHARAVDAAALSAFVAALAQLVHSPGPIPFSTATFGAIRSLPSGEIVGELAIESGVSASLVDLRGVLSYAVKPTAALPARARKLTLAQLGALVGALSVRQATATPPFDPLWSTVRADAVAAIEASKASLLAARGTVPGVTTPPVERAASGSVRG